MNTKSEFPNSPKFDKWVKEQDERLAKEKEKFPDMCVACGYQNRVFRVEQYGTSSASSPNVLEEHCDIIKAKEHILKYIKGIIELDKTMSQREIFLKLVNPDFDWPDDVEQDSLRYSYDEWKVIFEMNGITINSQKELDKQMQNLLDKNSIDTNVFGGLAIKEYKIITGEETVSNNELWITLEIKWQNLRLTTAYTVIDNMDDIISGFSEY